MTILSLAVAQMTARATFEETVAVALGLVAEAARQGAQVVLLPEMFSAHFFSMREWDRENFTLAASVEDSRLLPRMAEAARRHGLVLPVSFFERANNAYFNSIMMIDADGSFLGIYRKMHIPVGPPNCFEKYYFNQGDQGFPVWRTRHGRLGVMICWDQWFPEAARVMALQGADALLYASGIGTRDPAQGPRTRAHWQRVMQGHAAANIIPVAASNRVSSEVTVLGNYTYFGGSFITGPEGEIVAEAGSEDEAVITYGFDLDAIRTKRADWGLFRDRRVDAYDALMTLDGRAPAPAR